MHEFQDPKMPGFIILSFADNLKVLYEHPKVNTAACRVQHNSASETPSLQQNGSSASQIVYNF